MKTRVMIAAVLVALCAMVYAKDIIRITFINGTSRDFYASTAADSITFSANGDSLCFATGEMIAIDSIDYIVFDWVEDTDSVPVQNEDSLITEGKDTIPAVTLSDTIEIAWQSNGAPQVKCNTPDVTVAVEGNNVTATNASLAKEYTYILSGESANGSFTLVSDYKSTLVLNGLTLHSALEEALNIKCGKRVNLVLSEGTVNTLSDATADNGQKGAIYCKGHLEVSGGGELNLTGNVKHALSTKEYCLLKKTTGTINVRSAANDGIHAGQYFQMNGGTVNISNVGGDGIQAEITDDTADEENGQLIIKGGNLSISTTGESVCGLQSDSLMILTGGTISISASGTGGKGIKTGYDLVIGNETNGEGPVLAVKTTGGASQDNTTGGNNQPGNNQPGNRPGWGWRPGGDFGGETESSGSSAKAIKCLGSYTQYGGDVFVSTTGSGAEGIESKQKTATAINFKGGNTYIVTYDDCVNGAGQINFTGGNVICYATGNDAIDSNYGKAGAITITDGVVIAFSQRGGAEMGFDCDNMAYVKITGGTAIAGGGSQGGMSTSLASGSTHYKVWSGSVSYTAGRYYSIVTGGSNILTFRMPCTVTSSLNVYAGESFKSGTTHYVYNSATAPKTGESILFRDSFDGTAEPLIWTGTDITTGTQTATFSPN